MTTKCAMHGCDEDAVGKAWDSQREDRPNYYCREHLELAKKLGHPIKLSQDTDVVYDEGEPP